MRNKKFFFFLILFFSFICTYSQADIVKIRYFFIRHAKTNWHLYTPENMKENSETYFETKIVDYIDILFDDYKDCVNKLNSYPTVTNIIDGIEARACVEIVFRVNLFLRKKVRIYFSPEGYFYFNENWHQKHNGLYFFLFRYFYDALIPIETINEAKMNLNNSREW